MEMATDKEIRPSHLKIEKFRNFNDVSFDLGRKITVISGQNGVGKSTILSLIASGSGLNKKSMLGSNFQPEFYDFFNVDKGEDFESYKLYLTYAEKDGKPALIKRLSFKDDSKSNRGIRIIPRTTNTGTEMQTLKEADDSAKEKYNVGGSARVKIPTIYLSLSRLYPLGERKDTVQVSEIKRTNQFYQKKANEKYKQWYNYVIPNSIEPNAGLSKVEKHACSRASLHMDIVSTPTLSQSIGQDNLGNIISALVDIYMLSLEENYSGALLCIDEIDVSLHPDTQIRLLDLCGQVAEELNIQFVVSTHSLTILQEMLKKEGKNSTDYKVVYLKTPLAPYVTKRKSYDLLKADMLGDTSFKKPKVKVYFEDMVGQKIFELLMSAFRSIFQQIKQNPETPSLRNGTNGKNYSKINQRILGLESICSLENNLNFIPVELGCEELLKISKVDDYFKRVIFILDGDVRHKSMDQKPLIRDYLESKYDPKAFQLVDRNHARNICFLPDYFAPESFLYAIIYKLTHNPLEHCTFWRGLDTTEETALYTPEKTLEWFAQLTGTYNNDDIKNAFGTPFTSEVWKFVCKSDMVTYYYSDYDTVEELLLFLENIKSAYAMAWPLTLSNRQT